MSIVNLRCEELTTKLTFLLKRHGQTVRERDLARKARMNSSSPTPLTPMCRNRPTHRMDVWSRSEKMQAPNVLSCSGSTSSGVAVVVLLVVVCVCVRVLALAACLSTAMDCSRRTG